MLLHKDFAALARIEEMRQDEIAKRPCPPGRYGWNQKPVARKGLPTQITQNYKIEPYREVQVIEEEVVR